MWNQQSKISIGAAGSSDLWTGSRVITITRQSMFRVDGTPNGKDASHRGDSDQTMTLHTEEVGEHPYDPETDFFLGTDDQTAVFAHLIDDTANSQESDSSTTLVASRVLLARTDDAQTELAMRAQALTQFHMGNPFCPVCGSRTVAYDWGRSRLCERCGTQHFPRIDPAIIVAITDPDDRLLLGHHTGWEQGRHSIFAGFVEAGESAEQAVYREVNEEVSLNVSQVRYAGSQPWPLPRSFMMGFHAHAEGEPAPDGSEILDARWFTRKELDDSVDAGRVILPPRSSIAYRLITGWRAGQRGDSRDQMPA